MKRLAPGPMSVQVAQPEEAVSEVRPAQRWHAAALICMLVLTAIAFGRAAWYGYLPWDDYENITLNANVSGATGAGLVRIWSSYSDGLYIPLTYTTWWVEKAIGLGSRTSHVINLLVHALNSWGVYLVGLLALGRFGRGVNAGAAALAGAAIWCVHPLHTEAVAWATGRKDLLAGFFALFSVVCYLQFLVTRTRRWYWVSLVLFGCSLLSKASAVLLPLALLFVDWPGNRQKLRHVAERLAPFLLLSVCAVALNSAAHAAVEQGAAPAFPISIRPLLVGESLAHYARTVLIPRNLSPVYEQTLQNIQWTPAADIALMIAALLLIAAGWRRSLPWLCVILAIIFVLPVCGVVFLHYQTISLTADRYMYLPLVPLAVLVAVAVRHSLRRNRAATCIVCSLIVASLAYLSFRQTAYWRDSLSLWSHAVQAAPRSAVAHSNLGMSLGEAGKTDEAFNQFETAVKLDPDYAFAQMNLATAYLQKGDAAAAQYHYEAAVRSNPRLVDAQSSLAKIYFQSQRLEDAAKAARAVLAQRPTDFTAIAVLASVLGTQGHPDEALKLVRESAAANPNDQQLQQLLQQAEAIAGSKR